MPTSEEIEQKALEYGVLVANVKKLREEEAELKKGNEGLAEQRGLLNKEIGDTQAAKERVRGELIEIEKQREIARQIKQEEFDAEKRVLEDQRKTLAQGTKNLAEIETALNARAEEVAKRERVVRDANGALDKRNHALTVEASRLELEAVTLAAREQAMTDREKAVEKREVEVGERLRRAETAESNQKSALEQSRALAAKASDDILGANARLQEIKDLESRNQEALRQIKLFVEVSVDALKYMKQNVRNYDAIDAYFKTTFPALVERTQDHV